MQRTLEHHDARVFIEELTNCRRRVEVSPLDKSAYVQGSPCETAYPVELIKLILDTKGPFYLCDEILREEDPLYLKINLDIGLFSYVEPDAFSTGRILDFGCGCAASTVILGRHFPAAEILGVELLAESLVVARARAAHFGLSGLRFELSPSETELPPGIGRFDFIILNAVFEHLLPGERHVIMRLLWEALLPGGVLFLNETPNRAFPLELHTTGLPLINYLPDRWAMRMARGLSRRVDRDESWETMLRNGIRGGTVGEIMGILRNCGDGEPQMMKPAHRQRRDMADLWYARSVAKHGSSSSKRIARRTFKTCEALTGIPLTPELTLAIRKS